MPAWLLHGVLGSPTVFLVLAWQVLNCWATLLALPACLSFPTCKQQTQCLWQDSLLPIGRFMSCPRHQHGAGATVSPGLPHVPSQFCQVPLASLCLCLHRKSRVAVKQYPGLWLLISIFPKKGPGIFGELNDYSSGQKLQETAGGRNCSRLTQSMLPHQMSVKPLGATGVMSKTQKAA